jgi:predicted DNA-binding protein
MKEDRPYRLSIRVSDEEMDKLSKLKEELGYIEHTALFLVKLALDMYDVEVEDRWTVNQNTTQA